MSYNEWKEYTLDEVCISITDGSHSSPKSVENGYPMASVKDMGYFEINIDSCRQISEEDYQKLVNGKCKPEINDVLIAKDGSYMKFVNVVKEEKDLVLLSSIAILKPNIDILNPLFLKYYLLTPNVKHELEYGYVSGSAIRRIVLKDFKRFPIKLPPLEEQEKIADILSSLDDKIELNNEMNKTLEEMAQSIFKRWFVDFEFPNEDGEPYKSSGGEMVDSELGMIPKGWEVKCLDDLASSISKGTTPTKKDIDLAQDEQTIKFLKVKDIDDNGNICIDKMENIPASVHYGKLKRSILHTGDIIFSIAGTIGKVCTIDERLNNSNMNQAVAFIRLDNIELLFGFILYLLKSDFIQNEIKANIVQAVQANVSLGTLKQLKFAYPNENILKMYNDIIMSIYKTQLSNKIEVENLIKVRDSLLPKLMSGEIMVK